MSEPRILSLIPPMTQLNTPYPSTAYLTGFPALARLSGGADGSFDRARAEAVVRRRAARHSGAACRRSRCKRHNPGTRAFSRNTSRRTAKRSRRSFDSCRGATRRWLIASPRGATCPKAGDSRRSITTSARMAKATSARLGLRRAGAAGSREAHGHAVSERHRRCHSRRRRSAFRVRALCGVAGGEPADLRSPARGAELTAHASSTKRCMR